MQTALAEAVKGYGSTSPNPVVGALIVKEKRILARGWHHRAGQPHAEIEAFRALPAPRLSQGATLYVTLEPCSTTGRTPPCTDAILEAGIQTVVVGALDPNPRHSGRGVELLRARGLEVITGVLEEECAHANRAFFKWITTGRPWVLLKLALTLDGRIARPPGEGQWLTALTARREVHLLRAQSDAVLIGAETLRKDDPSLLVRYKPLPEGKMQPWRVIVSRGQRELPPDAQVFTDAHRDRTLVYRGVPLPDVLDELGVKYAVNQVLVEGGGEIAGALFEAGLVDEVCFYLAPLLSGGPAVGVAGLGAGSTLEAVRLGRVEYRKVGRDLRMRGLVVRS